MRLPLRRSLCPSLSFCQNTNKKILWIDSYLVQLKLVKCLSHSSSIMHSSSSSSSWTPTSRSAKGSSASTSIARLRRAVSFSIVSQQSAQLDQIREWICPSSSIQNFNAHTSYYSTNYNAIMVFQFLVCDRVNIVNLINMVMVVNHLVNCAVYLRARSNRGNPVIFSRQ